MDFIVDNKENKKIGLVLHHNYLQIEKDGKTLQLPVRCAKIIHDMYESRNAKNEDEDIEHYTDEFNDFEYEVLVFQMNARIGSELGWNKVVIKPLKNGIEE